jgi:hypothetical protein
MLVQALVMRANSLTKLAMPMLAAPLRLPVPADPATDCHHVADEALLCQHLLWKRSTLVCPESHQ